MGRETETERIDRLTELVRKARSGEFPICVENSGADDDLDALADEIGRLGEELRAQKAGREAAEEATRYWEDRYRRLETNIPGMVYLFALHRDGTFSFPFVNEASLRLFDIPPEELMADANRLMNLIHPADRERFDMSVLRSAETLEPWRLEVRHVVNGEVRWYDCMSHPEKQNNGDIIWNGIILEITGRKRAEEALRANEERMRLYFERQLVGMAITSPDKGWLQVNDRLCRMLGYERDELTQLTWTEMTHPADLAEDMACFERILKGEIDEYAMEKRFIRKDGATVFTNLSVACVRTATGAVDYILALVEDITERKRAEESLQRTDLLLRSLFDAIPALICFIDRDYHIVLANWHGGYEYVPESVRDGHPHCYVAFYGLDKPCDHCHVKEVFETGKPVSREKFNPRIGYVEILAYPIFDDAGEVALVVEHIHDISARKQAEEDLKLSHFTMDKASLGIFRSRADARILFVNEYGARMLGYSPEELRTMSFFDIDPFLTPEVWSEHREKLVATGSNTFERVHRRKDGTLMPVEVTVNLLTYGDQEFICSFSQDITTRKQYEDALRKSEEKFRTLTETSAAAIVLYQGERIIYANPATSRMLGYSGPELLQMRFWDFVHPEYRETVRCRGLARQRGELVPNQYEIKVLLKKGEERWAIASAGGIEYKGKPAGIVTMIDITESRRWQELISSSLAEKELLLKEVHHRVKNNLQIISTLLDLQSEFIEDTIALASFRESQDRIKAMALIHERLYEAENFASVDFAEYIENLSSHLFNSYQMDPGRITLKVDAGGVCIGIDKAIPCGLIINELLSNAMKYAFPDKRSGEISVRFDADSDDWVTLSVADTGVGLPPGLDPVATGTLGLQLVSMLAKQLGGEVIVGSGAGAMFAIRFRRTRTT